MRTFIAIIPPPPATGRLSALGAGLRSIAPRLRLEHASKLHFTLEFLGEKDDAWLACCRDALAEICPATPPFEVRLERVGFFPQHAAPRIIWAGSDPEENLPLCALAAAVKGACARLGHAVDEKPFHPHITLSRVKMPLSHRTIDRIAALTFDPLVFSCTGLSIMTSTLHEHGSEYTPLYELPLGR